MRKPEFISPTSLSTWLKDSTDYYVRYLSDNRAEKEPQDKAMSVGSAFDAFVKAYLHEAFFGKGADPRFAKDAIFEAQVQPHNRDFAKEAGEHCFYWYGRVGALAALVRQLGKSVGKPRFELDVGGKIFAPGKTTDGVPFFGKPDLFFVNEHDAHVILDWKVNGYVSKSGVSPVPGYVWLREDGKFPSAHADAKVQEVKGIFVNTAKNLEVYNEDWARQESIYSWLCGEEVGAKFIAQIHQIVCRPGDTKPRIRVAEHSTYISKEFQDATFKSAQELWQVINSDHIFRHLSKEESAERCKLLDQRADADPDDWKSMA